MRAAAEPMPASRGVAAYEAMPVVAMLKTVAPSVAVAPIVLPRSKYRQRGSSGFPGGVRLV